MGLDQLRRSIEMKARVDTPRTAQTNTRNVLLKAAKKPLMERYRRQKINNYLEELKCLVLSALNKEASLYNKMEKADILDMAVKYIKAVRPTTPEPPTTEYRQHYEHCTSGYPMDRASPLAVHSGNINYNNLSTMSKAVKKECAINGNERFAQSASSEVTTQQKQPIDQEYRANQTFLTQTENSNEQKVMQITRTERENPEQVSTNQNYRFNQTFPTQNENYDPSVSIVPTSAIWRPW